MPQSSNLVMLETDLDNVFSAFHLPAYKSVCRSFIQVCNQIQKFNFRCQSVTITHWIMQEQTKRTSSIIISLKTIIKWYMNKKYRQSNVLHSLLELGKLTLGWACYFFNGEPVSKCSYFGLVWNLNYLLHLSHAISNEIVSI